MPARAALLLAFAVMLSGCAGSNAMRDDAGAIRVAWHRIPTDRVGLVCVSMQTARAAAWLERTRITVHGCYRIVNQVCHIYAAEDSRALGHELRHCFDGRWHGERLDES